MVVRNAPVFEHVQHSEQAARPRRAEVADVVDLTARMRRVTLTGDLADLPVAGPTDHLKVFFPIEGVASEPVLGPRGLAAPPPGRPRPYREYTVRRHLGDALEIDMVRHGAGLAGAWIEDPDGPLWLYGPRSGSAVAPRGWYLLGGDETALPALARWLETADGEVTVLAEVADAAEEGYPGLAGDPRVRWLHRDGAAPGTTTLLGDAVADWTPPGPAGDGVAWMGAEAGVLRPVRRRLRDLLPGEAIDLDGYWRRGVEGTGLG